MKMTKQQVLQYLRWLPAQIGLFNKAAFRMQINAIYDDDLFIVSYPKSGNTWLRFIVAYLKQGLEKEIQMSELEQIVPDVYVSKGIINSRRTDRIIKTHAPFFKYYPKMIYIYRDYRDVLVSYYHYRTGVGEFKGTFSEFLRSEFIIGHFGSWSNHIEQAFKTKKERPGNVLILKYEDQLLNFVGSAKAINAFCNFNRVDDYTTLEKLTRFETLKKNELDHGSAFMELSQAHFFREGKYGNWRSCFSSGDLDFIYGQENVVNTLKKLGYTIDPI
jgi:estrone sulfotransferase